METNEEIKRVDPPAEENNEAQPVAVNATEPAEDLAATPQPATEGVPPPVEEPQTPPEATATPVEEPPVAPASVAEQPIVTETPAPVEEPQPPVETASAPVAAAPSTPVEENEKSEDDSSENEPSFWRVLKTKLFSKKFFIFVFVCHLIGFLCVWFYMTSSPKEVPVIDQIKQQVEASQTKDEKIVLLNKLYEHNKYTHDIKEKIAHQTFIQDLLKALLDDEDRATFKQTLPLLRDLYNYGNCTPETRLFLQETLLTYARKQITEAQLFLADTYVKKDAKETLFWWNIAANNAFNADAQFALGCAFARGYNGVFSEKLALDFLTLAKDQGHAAAFLEHLYFTSKQRLPKIERPKTANDYLMLGLYAATGYNMPNIDLVLAKKHLTTALEKGSTEAAIFLSALEQKQGNHTQAIEYLKLANKRNPNPSVQTLLAFRLMRQDPTPETCTYCMDLLLQATQSQHAPALYLLGHYTLQGKMNPPEQPIAYFRKATEIKPFPAAAYAYGDCLFCGKGGAEQSPEKAAVWIKMAANGSYLPAQWRLAEMYNSGIGLPMDKAKANEWAQRANKADSRPRMDTF